MTSRHTATALLAILLAVSMESAAQVGLEIPRLRNSDHVIKREAYTLSFNELHHLANWVAYVLTADETVARVNRFDGVFTPDPLLAQSPDNTDYLQSGYDRGHLAPAADMEFSQNTMQESFFFSNIAPQTPAFNRGIWKRLECLQRLWAKEYDSVYIITGPVLTSKLKTIGPHNVSVPRYFYKVIMRKEKDGRFVALGFVLPNRDSNSKLSSRVVSVDSVENATGLDFFHLLPDNVEKAMECVACAECWNWHPGDPRVEVAQTSNNTRNQTQNKNNGKKRQCTATTQSGKRCQRLTGDPSGRCYQHR